MDIIIIVLLSLVLAVGIILLIKSFGGKGSKSAAMSDNDKKEIKESFSSNIRIISEGLESSARKSSELINSQLEHAGKLQDERLTAINSKIRESGEDMDKRLGSMEKSQTDKLEYIRQTLERSITQLQEGNEKKLSEIKHTVDEKLTESLNEKFAQSFKILSEELEKVSHTMGEMKKISSEVGTLSKMLSGVKTAGIFGEIQLGAIIEQILSPEQYVKNVVTNKYSRDPVEFAVKFPGGEGGEVLLPIDSKFPYTVYSDMQAAYENNDLQELDIKRKLLVSTVRNMAKDIYDKYICPPATTNFAVMFLPVEGLYCEVVRLGLIDELHNKYKVTIAGPTTMAALLNSLQMGFQTLAIQKKSNEVWNILSAVKAEFDKFNGMLADIQKRLNLANNDLDKLIGTRSRAITRTLKSVSVSTLDRDDREELLGIPKDNTDKVD